MTSNSKLKYNNISINCIFDILYSASELISDKNKYSLTLNRY